MKAVWITIGIVMMSCAVLAQSPAPPAVAPPGASSCSGCHGSFDANQSIPSLQGWPAADVVRTMQAFREGRRQNTVMGRIAKGFTDDEVQAIAEWLTKK